MISDAELVIFVVTILLSVFFVVLNVHKGNVRLLHRMYFCVTGCLVIWMAALIGVKFTDPENTFLLYIWDALMYLGGPFASAFSLLIALVFVKGIEKFPLKYYLFFIPPVITNIMVWTNPWHCLLYTSRCV